ncbi:MAG: hypothetical protein ABSB35_02575 [Bryobacteraceae bacterium]|jgi:hypothetical protein
MNPPEEGRPLESCHAAEARIQAVERLLLESRPGSLEQCETELREVAVILQRLVSEGKGHFSPETGAAFKRIKQATGRLQRQVEHASNLWTGWLQLRLGTGYTDRGRPVFSGREPGTTFEV